MPVKVKIVGDKEVNKRLSNLRRYALRVVGAPVPTLLDVHIVDAALEQARLFYKAPTNGPIHPLNWKSRKQQIAVIIRLKEEGNLPYRRTGRLENAWSSSMSQNEITIANTARDSKTGKFIAPFVIGTFQQPFHKDTGWTKRSADIERQIIKPISDELLKKAKEGIANSRNG